MKSIASRSKIAFAALLTLTVGLGACRNPVDHEDDHPVGLVVVNAQGQQVASFQVAGRQTTGQIVVAPQVPTTFTVFATAEDGDRIAIDGTELTLAVQASGGVATATVQAANQLVVTGNQLGSGTVRITLNHEGHPEFVADIPLVVRT